jgi:hypothetical protein
MGWFGWGSRKAVPLDEQLRILAECGVRPAPGVEPGALTRILTPAQLETDPFSLTLTMLGGELDGRFLSDDIWHFDTECIEDTGDYARIARRLVTLAKGELPLEGIDDYVNVEDGEAWIEFSLDGVRQRWEAQVEDDWVDTTIVSRLARLLVDRRASERRFTSIDLGGQSVLIGCATPAERTRFRKLTGLAVGWLE